MAQIVFHEKFRRGYRNQNAWIDILSSGSLEKRPENAGTMDCLMINNLHSLAQIII